MRFARACRTSSSPANDEGNLALVDQLLAAGLLDRAGLVRLLLRRADEERIATGAKARSGRREARVVQGLVSHSDGAVAAAAMALIIARGRRRDRFGQCLLHFDDLPRDDGAALVRSLAAAFVGAERRRNVRPQADRLLSAAIAQVLARTIRRSSIEDLTADPRRLARRRR